MSKLIDRIDATRVAWSSELEVCRNDILDTVRVQHAVSRLVVEFDYLLVEAKIALEAKNAIFRDLVLHTANDKEKINKLKTQIEILLREER